MLTRVPFWPLRRVSCIIYPLRILPICSIHFTLFRVQQKKTCCRGPPSLFFKCAPHIVYQLSRDSLSLTTRPYIYFTFFKHFTQYFAYSSKIVCYLRVTYLLPTNHFLLLLKATKKPFNRAFCFKHSTFKLTFKNCMSLYIKHICRMLWPFCVLLLFCEPFLDVITRLLT